MKILLLTSLYRPYFHGGSEKAATLLAEALAATGHQVSVITLHPESTQAIEELNGVRVYRLPLDNLYWPFNRQHPANTLQKIVWHLRDIWNLRAALRIGRVLDLEQPDVVHSHSLAGFSASALKEVKRRNIRLVHTLHDYYLVCLKSSMFKSGHTCQQRCASCTLATLPRRYTATFIDVAVPVSNYLLDQHRAANYLTHTPTQVLPNISHPASSETQPPRTIRTPLIFGYIGRIEPHKGIEVLLKACSTLTLPDWKLRIAGHAASDYLQHLQQTFPDPRIEWLGFIHAAAFFHSIDICIVPSLWPEPQPYVVLEALDAGKSIIASNSGGLPEMAAFAKCFATFPTGDSKSLARILDETHLHPDVWRYGGFRSVQIRDQFQPHHVLAAHQSLYASQPDTASTPNHHAFGKKNQQPYGKRLRNL
jgi:glycosyltransferase involved in cell wall biosynthesis